MLDLVAGLVRAQADALAGNATFRPFVALAGMLGLRDVPDLPALPLADLPTRGIAAIVDWVEGLLADDDARDAWLGQLATPGRRHRRRRPATRWSSTSPRSSSRSASASRPGPAATRCWCRGWRPRSAPGPARPVVARAAVDLLRADTGSGACVAVPDVRLEAVFGENTAGRRLIGPAATDTPARGQPAHRPGPRRRPATRSSC